MGDATLFPGAVQPWVLPGRADASRLTAIREGRLELGITGARDLRYDGDFWSRTPGVTDSQHMLLHALRWLSPLVVELLHTHEPRTTPDWALLNQLLESWRDWEDANPADTSVWDGHPAALRTQFLVGLTELLPDEEWLADLLGRHARHLAEPDNFSGFWNHGLTEALALYAAGQRLGDLEAVATARERIVGCVAEMVDDEGAINEQAPGYATYIFTLLEGVERGFAHNNDAEGASFVQERARLLEPFILHCLNPLDHLEQIGDTYDGVTPSEIIASARAGGRLPEPNFGETGRVAVYRRGYLLARSGWGERRPAAQEDYFTLRFGPGRIIHGHNDHLSLTWFTAGQRVIIDSGHGGYTKGPYRAHLQSPQAHNVLEVVDQRHGWDQETELLGHYQTPGTIPTLIAKAGDSAYAGVRRTRTVVFTPHAPLLTFDAATAKYPRHLRQLWHVAPQFTELVSSDGYFRVRDPKAGLDLVVLPVPVGPEVPDLELEHWRGATDPHQGWHSLWEGEAEPNFALGIGLANTTALRLATVLLTVPAAAEVSHRLKPRRKLLARSPHGHTLTVSAAGSTHTWELDVHGDPYLQP